MIGTLLDKLGELRASPWQGEVFRHMFGDYPPDRENQRGPLRPRALATLGISEDDLASLDHRACQRVGGAIERLGNDGLLVPSVRADGVDLVVFPNRQKAGYEFRVIDSDVINWGSD